MQTRTQLWNIAVPVAAAVLALAGIASGGTDPKVDQAELEARLMRDARSRPVTTGDIESPAVANAVPVRPGVAGVVQDPPKGGVKALGGRAENNGAGMFDNPPVFDPAFQAYVEALREANDPHHFDNAPTAPDQEPAGRAVDPETPAPVVYDGTTEAPNDFTYWRNRSLDGDIGGSANFSDRTNEPSLGPLQDSVLWTGNWYAAISTARGLSFQYINPYDNFPADGTNDVPSGAAGFCCDQVVATGNGITVWLLQYGTNGSSNNVQRLAIANSEEDVRNNNWYWYDFDAQDFGYPTGRWLDFPDIMITSGRLFVSTNVFDAGGANQGEVVWSISTSELAAGGGLNYWYYQTTNGTKRMGQGSTTTGWYAHHLDTNTVRLWNWDGTANAATLYDVNHGGFSTGNNSFTGPSGCSWMGRADSRILGGAVGGGEIALMWNASRDGTFPQPYVDTLRIRLSDRAVIQERAVWNSTGCWSYPSASSNSAGNFGGVITFGDSDTYPSPAAFLADDVNGRALANGNVFVGVGSTCQSQNRWGDYFTTRRSTMGTENYVSASFYNSSASGTQPMFSWFGRERDDPGSDLKHISTTTTANAVYQPGDPISVGYNFRNVGAANTVLANVDARLSTNTIISGGDVLLGAVARGPLGLGTTASGTINGTIPVAQANGSYFIGTMSLPGGDGDTSNNYTDYNQNPIPVTVRRRPDIEVVSVNAFPTRAGLGQTFGAFSFVTWTNRNNGTLAANYDVDIRASVNTTISTFDEQIVFYSPSDLGPLAPNASQGWVNNVITIPSNITPGTYYIGVISTVPDDANTGNNTNFDAVPIVIDYCDADVTRDGDVTLDDFFFFLNCFAAQDPCGDIDGNAGTDLGDYFYFFNAWASGCWAD